MKAANAAAIAMAFCLPFGANADTLEEALGLAGLDKKTATFNPTILSFYTFDEFTMPSFGALSRDPFFLPRAMTAFADGLQSCGLKASEALMWTRPILGHAPRRTLLGDPTAAWQQAAKSPDGLQKALTALEASSTSAPDVPKPAAEAAALVLNSVIGTEALFSGAFREISDRTEAFSWLARSETDWARKRKLMRSVDLGQLYAAAHDLFLASQTAADWLRTASVSTDFEWSANTRLGKVLIRGAGSHITPPGEYLLILDLGGDDLYLAGGANASASNWASVLLDVSGNDRYLSHEELASSTVSAFAGRSSGTARPAQGGALMGAALVLDMSGNDIYRCIRPAQGSGVFGVGALVDYQGQDVYDAYTNSQGFGDTGVGILIDGSGDDGYSCFSQSQACGLTLGAGILSELGGNDVYISNDEQIDFPSPQSSAHNVSMSQGAGYGLRADFSDGHSLGGGLGFLLDTAGDDSYACAVFGQGVGYWQGIGAVCDLAGNDRYSGLWYVQGACAHFAIGYLEDRQGDDVYKATMNMAQGAGHDFSVGWLTDGGGNDSYSAPNLSLGAGNASGIGVFREVSGNDTYASSGTTLGKANPGEGAFRSQAICMGVFVDEKGSDAYPKDLTWAGNSVRTVNWAQKRDAAADSQFGVFLDGE